MGDDPMRNWDTTREDTGLTVRVEQDGDALVLSALGELNPANFNTLESELRMALAGNASEVTLNLGSVSFTDSVGRRAVLLMARQSLRNGDRLRLLRGSAPLEQAIMKSGVGHLLPAHA